MFSGSLTGRFVIIFAALFLALNIGQKANAACVWKVTGPQGCVLYLGGSIHGLHSTDYPLPAAYNRAFDACSRLMMEEDPNTPRATLERFFKSGLYPKSDSLKNHLDPRVYDYLRRFFAARNFPEAQLSRLHPWMLLTLIWSRATNELGIEAFLARRAQANHKPVTGLETFNDHMAIVSGLTDHQAEVALLFTLIPASGGTDLRHQMINAWRNGEVDKIARMERDSMRDLPSLHERLLEARNRNWIPKIERAAQSGQIYFVVAGAAHMGGPDGVIALLRKDGYRIEQM